MTILYIISFITAFLIKLLTYYLALTRLFHDYSPCFKVTIIALFKHAIITELFNHAQSLLVCNHEQRSQVIKTMASFQGSLLFHFRENNHFIIFIFTQVLLICFA